MRAQPCLLSVNVNKIATLRNSRGADQPHLATCVQDLIDFGAQGITVHPRPDERHIKLQDVFEIQKLLKKINKKRISKRFSRGHKDKQRIEFNIEGYPSPSFLKMVLKVKPEQVTLVPDGPKALTSHAGWALKKNMKVLRRVTTMLNRANIRVSIFIDVFAWNKNELQALSKIKPNRVELYTEKYAKDYVTKKRLATTSLYKKVVDEITPLQIGINAGHDLNLNNVRYLLQEIPQIEECSIGHALISESLYLGFEKTIQNFRNEMK